MEERLWKIEAVEDPLLLKRLLNGGLVLIDLMVELRMQSEGTKLSLYRRMQEDYRKRFADAMEDRTDET